MDNWQQKRLFLFRSISAFNIVLSASLGIAVLKKWSSGESADLLVWISSALLFFLIAAYYVCRLVEVSDE